MTIVIICLIGTVVNICQDNGENDGKQENKQKKSKSNGNEKENL